MKRIPRILSPLLLCTAVLFVACAEDTIEPVLMGNIEGTVLDAETALPLGGASVSTNPATDALLTALDGTFILRDVPVGTYSVQASRAGYQKETVSITVRENQTATAQILLEVAPETNNPPRIPMSPMPYNRADDLNTQVQLSWSGGDPDQNDSTRYIVTVYEGTDPTPFSTFENLADTLLLLSGLRFNTVYYWQVTARDMYDEETRGEVWSFRTRPLPAAPFLFTSAAGGNENIFRTDSTEANTVQLTAHPGRDLWPRWNRWRSKIAFISDREGAYHIYSMLPDGSQQTRLTSVPVDGYHNNGIGFAWTPDGGWLYYPHYDKIYRIDQFGSNLSVVVTAPAGRHFREIEWSPQYDRIVALTIGVNHYDSEIYLYDRQGNDPELLVDNLSGALGSPSFSIDGEEVVYTQDRSGYESTDGRQLDACIYMIHVDTKDTACASGGKPPGTNDLYPRFSPDGAWILFVNQPNDRSRPGDLYIMRRDGTERRMIARNVTSADWR